ncbi:rhomboid family intramembrane serine protease [Sagittula sp. SSi028]|uniref:rhomboid family intramembrane serine protease n=1 Tax=Sagittula sp. SSi028 TaxID=3400636 RepID=UPI003AF8EFF1
MSDPNDPRHPINEAPVNPLPPVVVALFLVLMGIEAVFSLSEFGLVGGRDAVGLRIEYIERFGFSGRLFDYMIETQSYSPDNLLRLVSYAFLHSSFYEGLFAMVFTLSMGKVVTEAMGPLAFVAIFFVSAAFGALCFGLLSDDPWLIGAFPAAFGLIGGFSYLLWVRLGQEGAPQMRAFSLIGMLMAMRLVFGLLFGTDDSWIADLAGFVAGFALAIVMVPGGLARIRGLLRR